MAVQPDTRLTLEQLDKITRGLQQSMGKRWLSSEEAQKAFAALEKVTGQRVVEEEEVRPPVGPGVKWTWLPDEPIFRLSQDQRAEMDRKVRESMGLDLPLEELTDEHLRILRRFAELHLGKLPKPENHT